MDYPLFGSVESCPKCGRYRTQQGNVTSSADKNNTCEFALSYQKTTNTIAVTCDLCTYVWTEKPKDATPEEPPDAE